jgi:hypothetical protein
MLLTRFWYGDMEKIPTNGDGMEIFPHGGGAYPYFGYFCKNKPVLTNRY